MSIYITSPPFGFQLGTKDIKKAITNEITSDLIPRVSGILGPSLVSITNLWKKVGFGLITGVLFSCPGTCPTGLTATASTPAAICNKYENNPTSTK